MAELVEAAEAVESIVEPVVSEVIKTAHMIDRRLAFAAFAMSTVGGVMIGYGTAGLRLRTKYQKIADREIEQMREHFILKSKAQEPKPELETIVSELGYTAPPVVMPNAPGDNTKAVGHIQYGTHKQEVEETTVVNVFEDVWDYAIETRSRNPAQPYIIHRDEFMSGQENYEQTTLTYFMGDDVLCDGRDTPIDDRDSMIGDDHLERFGHGSGDPNVLYVRNETLDTDFEIVRSTGKYAQEVHGFSDDDSLTHAMERRGRHSRRLTDD